MRQQFHEGRGGSGGESIDLNIVASAPFAQSQLLISKICEFCGKGFFRSALTMWKECEPCRTRLAKIAAERAIMPPPDEQVRRNMRPISAECQNARQIADHALSMRSTA